MIVLGIETSCDETAAAVVTGERQVLADLVLSQCADHAPYGGVVPEIAARSHVEHLDGLIARAMDGDRRRRSPTSTAWPQRPAPA